MIKNENITIVKKDDCKYFYIDNWFSNEQLNLIWKELDFLTASELERASKNVAHIDGKFVGDHFRIYPNEIYTNPIGTSKSFLINSVNLQKNEQFKDLVFETFGTMGRMWFSTNMDTTFISYYENNDYYDSHCDCAAFSVLIWLYKKPKKFTGGDLYLTDYNEKIDCVSNRLLIIPSFYNHQVDKLNFKGKKGWGRYTLTTFYLHIPQTNIEIYDKNKNIKHT